MLQVRLEGVPGAPTPHQGGGRAEGPEGTRAAKYKATGNTNSADPEHFKADPEHYEADSEHFVADPGKGCAAGSGSVTPMLWNPTL